MFYKAKDIFTLAMFKFHEPKLLLKAKISSWTKISLKSFTKYCIVFISGVKKCIDPLMGTNLFGTACICDPIQQKVHDVYFWENWDYLTDELTSFSMILNS